MESNQGYDINVLRQEAQRRWLKPKEVLSILQNYEEDQLTPEPPQKPPSGSLFLFNRRILRFFRKDGYSWHKKKDGRTVGEAHERLKVGNTDTLNCYYAHGDPNSKFQRRSYWMLDPARDHIVLVHYRDVTEGGHNAGPKLLGESNSSLTKGARYRNSQNPGSSGFTDLPDLHDSYQSSSTPEHIEDVGSNLPVENNGIDRFNGIRKSGSIGSSCESELNVTLRKLSEQLSLEIDDDSAEMIPHSLQNENLKEPEFIASTSGVSSRDIYADEEWDVHDGGLEDGSNNLFFNANENIDDLLPGIGSGIGNDSSDKFLMPNSVDTGKQHSQRRDPISAIERREFPSWKEMLDCCSTCPGVDMQKKTSYQVTQEEFLNSTSLSGYQAKNMASHDNGMVSSDRSNSCVTQAEQVVQLLIFKEFTLDHENPTLPPTSSDLFQEIEETRISSYSSRASNLDATKRNSIERIDTRDMPLNNHKIFSDYPEVMLGQDCHLGNPLGPDLNLTVSHIQRFSIREISPEWAYANEGTKVIVTGDFLFHSSECTWACLFGEIEVPAEVIQTGVLRCHAPPHVAGKVNFCVTAGNRESCSEVRDFEYRDKPKSYVVDTKLPQADATRNSEEMKLLLRFAGMLLLGYDILYSPEGDGSVEPQMSSDPWREVIEALLVGSGLPSYNQIMDWLLQELLKDKLQQWLSSKYEEGDDTVCSMSKQEQGVIHMIAGLGYEWALNPILKAGVGVNFRDINGWTALHWAALFGREKMVAALVAVGASAVAVTDATSKDPVGKNPASIAASRGHKGLAGYLSELALTSHLSLLTLEESEISKGSAAVEAEKAVESIAERTECSSSCQDEDQLSLKDSLAAVRNAAQAAARIQAAFRAHSFRKKQLRALMASYDDYGLNLVDIQGLSATMQWHWAFCKLHDLKLNKAALSIQKKYRGWKRRKEFLTLRKNVVKIQAHVRGHQVRKKYKELLWTVSVLEKVILRWRRKGVGLRGFRHELESMDETEEEDILKVFRKLKVDSVIEEALSRVLSMVECHEARHQYHRILERYRQAKARLIATTSEQASSSQANEDFFIEIDCCDI